MRRRSAINVISALLSLEALLLFWAPLAWTAAWGIGLLGIGFLPFATTLVALGIALDTYRRYRLVELPVEREVQSGVSLREAERKYRSIARKQGRFDLVTQLVTLSWIGVGLALRAMTSSEPTP